MMKLVLQHKNKKSCTKHQKYHDEITKNMKSHLQPIFGDTEHFVVRHLILFIFDQQIFLIFANNTRYFPSIYHIVCFYQTP